MTLVYMQRTRQYKVHRIKQYPQRIWGILKKDIENNFKLCLPSLLGQG